MEASKVGSYVLYENLEDELLQSMRRCVIWSNSGEANKGRGLGAILLFTASGYARHPASPSTLVSSSHFSTT